MASSLFAMVTLLVLHGCNEYIRIRDLAVVFGCNASSFVHFVLDNCDPRHIRTGFEVLAETAESPIKDEIRDTLSDGSFSLYEIFIDTMGLTSLTQQRELFMGPVVRKWMADILLPRTIMQHGVLSLPFC